MLLFVSYYLILFFIHLLRHSVSCYRTMPWSPLLLQRARDTAST